MHLQEDFSTELSGRAEQFEEFGENDGEETVLDIMASEEQNLQSEAAIGARPQL